MEGDFKNTNVFLSFKKSPLTPLPKRGKEREPFAKEGEMESRYDPHLYMKSKIRFAIGKH